MGIVISSIIKGKNFLYNCFGKTRTTKLVTAPEISPKNTAQIIGNLKSDIFEKEKVSKFIPIQELYPREMTPEWFKSLSKENYQKYMDIFGDYSINTVNPALTKIFDKYTDLLKKNLEILSGNKPYKFIAIGQTPALFSEILRIKGVDTGTVPISSLTHITNSEIKKLTPKNLKPYLEHIKSLGVNIEKFSPDKNYFFVDYSDTGNTLKNFQTILNQFGIKGNNVHVMSIQDLMKTQLSINDTEISKAINNFYLRPQVIKDFSPIHKLNYDFLNEAKNIMPKTRNRDTSIRSKVILLSLLKKYYPQQ